MGKKKTKIALIASTEEQYVEDEARATAYYYEELLMDNGSEEAVERLRRDLEELPKRLEIDHEVFRRAVVKELGVKFPTGV